MESLQESLLAFIVLRIECSGKISFLFLDVYSEVTVCLNGGLHVFHD